jgi:hypothetical protein
MWNARMVLTVAVATLVTTAVARWTLVTGADEVQAARLHGEQVFRLQNAVVSRLIDAGESGAPQSAHQSAALLAAEDRIVSDCRHLNEAASLSAVGGEPGPGLRLRVLDTLESCESSALALGMQFDGGATARQALLP